MQKAARPATASARGTNPVIGAFTTLTMMAAGRMRFHPEDVDKILETDDGARYRVFRHVTVTPTWPPSPCVS